MSLPPPGIFHIAPQGNGTKVATLVEGRVALIQKQDGNSAQLWKFTTQGPIQQISPVTSPGFTFVEPIEGQEVLIQPFPFGWNLVPSGGGTYKIGILNFPFVWTASGEGNIVIRQDSDNPEQKWNFIAIAPE